MRLDQRKQWFLVQAGGARPIPLPSQAACCPLLEAQYSRNKECFIFT